MSDQLQPDECPTFTTASILRVAYSGNYNPLPGRPALTEDDLVQLRKLKPNGREFTARGPVGVVHWCKRRITDGGEYCEDCEELDALIPLDVLADLVRNGQIHDSALKKQYQKRAKKTRKPARTASAESFDDGFEPIREPSVEVTKDLSFAAAAKQGKLDWAEESLKTDEAEEAARADAQESSLLSTLSDAFQTIQKAIRDLESERRELTSKIVRKTEKAAELVAGPTPDMTAITACIEAKLSLETKLADVDAKLEMIDGRVNKTVDLAGEICTILSGSLDNAADAVDKSTDGKAEDTPVVTAADAGKSTGGNAAKKGRGRKKAPTKAEKMTRGGNFSGLTDTAAEFVPTQASPTGDE